MKVERSKNSVIKICGIFLFPKPKGQYNVVAPNKVEAFLADKTFNEQLELGFCKIVEDEKPKSEKAAASGASGSGVEDTDEVDYSKLNGKAATKYVKGLESIEDLESILEDEERKGVITAIEKRIEELQEAAEAAGDDGDND